MPSKRNRPGRATEAIPKTFVRVESSLADRAAFALVVLAEMSNGQVRRRVMFSLPNAQRAVERTRARGLSASLHLVRLLPVPMADLDSLALDELGGAQ